MISPPSTKAAQKAKLCVSLQCSYARLRRAADAWGRPQEVISTPQSKLSEFLVFSFNSQKAQLQTPFGMCSRNNLSGTETAGTTREPPDLIRSVSRCFAPLHVTLKTLTACESSISRVYSASGKGNAPSSAGDNRDFCRACPPTI